MKANRFQLIIMVLSCFFLASGCRTIRVDSYPPGANIFIDGVQREERTPYEYSVRDFATGSHSVVVEKEGFKAATPTYFIIGISGGDVFWSIIFPPVLLKNLFHDRWKAVTSDNLKSFELMPDTAKTNLPRLEEEIPEVQDTMTTRIKQLGSLRDQKLITEEEYKAKRQSLLDEL